MSVRMIPSLTEDGDMRFDVFEHPKMTIVGRFFVNPTMDEVSMVANGAFCTREMVISKQKRSYFAARKDNRKSISEPYSVLLEMMPVARIYTSKIELEHTIQHSDCGLLRGCVSCLSCGIGNCRRKDSGVSGA